MLLGDDVVHPGRRNRVSQTFQGHPAVAGRKLELLARKRIFGGQARAIAYCVKAAGDITCGHNSSPDRSVSPDYSGRREWLRGV